MFAKTKKGLPFAIRQAFLFFLCVPAHTFSLPSVPSGNDDGDVFWYRSYFLRSVVCDKNIACVSIMQAFVGKYCFFLLFYQLYSDCRLHFPVFRFASAEMKFAERLLLRESEIGTRRLCARLSRAIAEACLHCHDIAPLFGDSAPNHQILVGGMHRLEIAQLHFRRHPCGLQLAGYSPRADFIQKRSLYPSVQRMRPSLVFRFRMPETNHFITVFIKLHFHSRFVVGRTAETEVTVHSKPRIDYLFHTSSS